MGKFTMSLDPTQAATGVARFSKCCSSQAATLEGALWICGFFGNQNPGVSTYCSVRQECYPLH